MIEYDLKKAVQQRIVYFLDGLPVISEAFVINEMLVLE